MKFTCFFTFFILYAFCGTSQQLQQVAHCPSNEVYDMLVDKKGFLWVAHNLGISRYDGISFTSFSNPAQSSLSVTDLIEDNYGRIWCHNFNGQVFYIQNDKMYYLEEYDFKKEATFPRMILYGDELFVTSSTEKGLFICNAATLKCRYASIVGGAKPHFKGILSLCILKNKVLAYGPNAWYVYTPKDGLTHLKNTTPLFKEDICERAALQPNTFGDTAFIFSNAEGVLYGITLKDDKLSVVFKKTVPASINSISILSKTVWINTKSGSFTLHGNDKLKDFNITAMLYDKQGNRWIGSLTNGLLAQYKTFNWKPIKIKELPGDDPVRYIRKAGDCFLISSKNSKLITTSNPITENGRHVYLTPSEGGTIENIQAAENNKFFVETSVSLCLLSANKKVFFEDSGHIGNVKDITIHNQTAYLALPSSVQILNSKAWKLQTDNKAVSPFLISDSLLYKVNNKTFLSKRMRCRAVQFDTSTNSLLISFSDGLQRLKENKLTFILYKGQPLYVSSLTRCGNKIYAATFNNGLFVIEKYDIKRIENNLESPTDGIIKLKLCNNHLWIFRVHDIEVLDVRTNEFITSIYPFPVEAAQITDAEEDNNNIYLATITGLYAMPLTRKPEKINTDITLLYVLVNNKDTILQNNLTLPANKNNLLFRLAIPVYKDADRLHFKYSLASGDDTAENTWYYTQDAQRDIQFNALKPGSYTIQITAMQNGREISNNHLAYHFTINKPWFNTWWFYTTVMLLTVSLSIGIYQYRLYQHLKMERMRRKISNDLHDDIGSTLSSINVYSQLAKGNYGNESYINTIQNNTVSIINNLDDLVWNINPKNDVLWQLITRMQLFAEGLLQENGIECTFKAKLLEKTLVVSPTARAHLYLLFKEIINNIIKHAGSTTCSVYIIEKNKALRLIVKDNGKGFNIKTTSQHRNGLRIMAERVKELGGQLLINSTPGEGTEVRIMCRLT